MLKPFENVSNVYWDIEPQVIPQKTGDCRVAKQVSNMFSFNFSQDSSQNVDSVYDVSCWSKQRGSNTQEVITLF